MRLLAIAATLFVAAASAQDRPAADTADEIRQLRELVQQLQSRVAQLEARAGVDSKPAAAVPSPPAAQTAVATPTDPRSDPLRGTTFNLLLDGYYGWNFNRPIGRLNLLRAYDVSSNSFSLNPAALVIENAPDPARGKRFGGRFDLQFGQATQTLQGNPANELRPEIYRAVFQAYGTYVAPVGKGLTVDFGKWASSLGLEGNYTKDQINYSRSFWFNFLPFYHMGLRANYRLNDALAVNYWVVNGAQQTEAFKGFKDQLAGLAIAPHKTLNWAVNYYLGQEHPDVVFYPNGGAPAGAPTFQGVPFEPIPNAPRGRLHILDSYATWQATPRLTVAAEGDYVLQRLNPNSPPSRTSGGALYGRYQLTPALAVAGRAEYLSDRGGLFSGTSQALKETTFTTEYKFGEGFLMRAEWRRDFSNQPYFLTDRLGLLNKEQNTATLGVVMWFGGKEGSW